MILNIKLKFLQNRTTKTWLGVAIIVVMALIWYRYFFSGSSNLPYSIAQTGLFSIELNETGRLRAENSVTISSPPIRGISLQIVDIVPEGSIVQEGDFLVQFDTTEINQQIEDHLAEIDMEKANMTRSQVSMKIQLASLASAVENSQASFRLSQLRLEQMEFESDVQKEEGGLNLFQAELSLTQAREKVKAQRQIDSVEVLSLDLALHQTEMDLAKTIRDKGRLTIKAPAPGLVVYKESWRGGSMSKVKIGDTPWRGQILLELPDLSVMMIETFVSEIDVAKVSLEQAVRIKLDAYADPVFNGKVVEIANIARQEDGLSEANVFDILIRIEGVDALHKPGMSATVDIIVDEIQDVVWVPIESVFNHNGNSVVYLKKRRNWKERIVEIGKRNNNSVIIEGDIHPGDIVALVDMSLSDEAISKQSEQSSVKKKGNGKNSDSKPSHRRYRRRG